MNQTLLQRLYAAALVIGSVVAVLVAAHGVQSFLELRARWGEHWAEHDLWLVTESLTGPIMLVVSILFLWLSPPRKAHWSALPIYVIGYGFCFFAAWVCLIDAGKHIAGPTIMESLWNNRAKWVLPFELMLLGLLFLLAMRERPWLKDMLLGRSSPSDF